jgi:hypothetical protein
MAYKSQTYKELSGMLCYYYRLRRLAEKREYTGYLHAQKQIEAIWQEIESRVAHLPIEIVLQKINQN